jgi:hypothetical protein
VSKRISKKLEIYFFLNETKEKLKGATVFQNVSVGQTKKKKILDVLCAPINRAGHPKLSCGC